MYVQTPLLTSHRASPLHPVPGTFSFAGLGTRQARAMVKQLHADWPADAAAQPSRGEVEAAFAVALVLAVACRVAAVPVSLVEDLQVSSRVGCGVE